MSNKSVKLFCFSCDVDYVVKFDDENYKINPEFCPFCGEYIDTAESEMVDEVEITDEEGW